MSDDNLPKRSLGKGQEKNADAAICRARERGQWIILQNCHMSPSFMPILETRVVETAHVLKINETKKKKKDEEEDDEEEDGDKRIRIDPKFRFWITTRPDSKFPTYIMQNSIKLTYEPSKGIKSNIIRCYNLLEKN